MYPVAQMALGAARLLPSARYAPLRLRLIRSLNALSASTGSEEAAPPGSTSMTILAIETAVRPAARGLGGKGTLWKA